MPTYVYRNGAVVEKTTAEVPARVHIIPDMEPGRSAITGEVIGGRKQFRDHCRTHGVVDSRDLKPYRDNMRRRRGL